VASGPDKAMACRYCQTTWVWRAWRKAYVFVWALDCRRRSKTEHFRRSKSEQFLVWRVLCPGGGQGVDSGVPEAVAGAFEGDDFGVVDDAVDHRGGDDLVSGNPLKP